MTWYRSRSQLKFFVEKMRLITLTSAPLVEISSELGKLFEIWQRRSCGKLTDEQMVAEYQKLDLAAGQLSPTAKMKVLWEPLSDARGDAITHKGWTINTTMYLWNGQPWWLLQASRDRSPTPPIRAALEDVVRMSGGDSTRDLLLELPNDGFVGEWISIDAC